MEIFSPRIRCISFSGISRRLRPSNSISPPVICAVLSGRSRRMERAVVVLPAPVSPTNPSVSPLCRSKEILLTAYTVSRSVLYMTSRSFTFKKVSFICISFLLILQFRIQCISQTVAGQIETESRNDDEDAWEVQQIRRAEHELSCIGKQCAPLW